MTPDQEILRLVDGDLVWWTKREGGSTSYQIHRTRIHQLVKEGYVLEIQGGCCSKDYLLTDKGLGVLNAQERQEGN